MDDIEKRAVIACSLSWGSLSDADLAAAVAGATFDAKPRLRRENRAFSTALSLRLIAEDGTMHDLAFRGLMHAARRFTEEVPRG